MLIINADDFGRSVMATDHTLRCYREGRVTSASVMMFMEDSPRAAQLAITAGMDTGLHLNFDCPLDGPAISPQMSQHYAKVMGYFRLGRWTHLLYNPFIRKDIDYVFRAQYEEYQRLFGKKPVQIDGHQHVHLCANVLWDGVIPPGLRVRRNFSFEPGEKSPGNRFLRRYVDARLARRHICADAFFSIEPVRDLPRLARIVSRANSSNVELMVHPAWTEQYEFLLSRPFGDLIADVPRGTYRMLAPAGGSR